MYACNSDHCILLWTAYPEMKKFLYFPGLFKRQVEGARELATNWKATFGEPVRNEDGNEWKSYGKRRLMEFMVLLYGKGKNSGYYEV